MAADVVPGPVERIGVESALAALLHPTIRRAALTGRKWSTEEQARQATALAATVMDAFSVEFRKL